MEVRQLRYFLAIARTGSFTAAARRSNTAQPALSAQIAKLEAELRCSLFTRGSRGVILTEAGERFFAHAERILHDIEAAILEFAAVKRPNKTKLTIGLPPSAARLLTLPLLEAVKHEMPTCDVYICEGMSSSLSDWLDEGKLDLAILHNFRPKDLRPARVIFEEDLYVVALKSISVVAGTAVYPEDLARIPLVVSSHRNGYRQLIDSIAERHRFRLNIIAEIDSQLGQRELVLKGAGALVMPLQALEGWPVDLLHLAPLTGPGMFARAHLVFGERNRDSPWIEQLSDLLLTSIDGLIASGQWPGARRLFHGAARQGLTEAIKSAMPR